MKRACIVFLMFSSVCLAVEPAEKSAQTPLPEIRKEHKEYRDRDGQLTRTIDRIYRGKDPILRTEIFKTKSGAFAAGGLRRIYSVDGKTVLIEDDYNGDGSVEQFTVCSGNGVEVFNRHRDGIVEPISSDELVKQKVEAAAASAIFVGAIQSAVTNSQNRSADDVMDDVERQAKDLEKSQKEKK